MKLMVREGVSDFTVVCCFPYFSRQMFLYLLKADVLSLLMADVLWLVMAGDSFYRQGYVHSLL